MNKHEVEIHEAKIRKQKAFELRRQGLTLQKIAAHLGVHLHTVERYLNPDYNRKCNQRKLRWENQKRATDPKYREKHNQRSRDYRRENILGTKINGKLTQLRVKKRPRPLDGNCEFCRKNGGQHLGYHHWDGDNLSLGVYTCLQCHPILEAIDCGKLDKVVNRYIELKRKIAEELKHLEVESGEKETWLHPKTAPSYEAA